MISGVFEGYEYDVVWEFGRLSLAGVKISRFQESTSHRFVRLRREIRSLAQQRLLKEVAK